LARITGIATVSESKKSHFTVFIAGVLIQCQEHIGLKRVDESHNRPALKVHLLQQDLFESELFPVCRFAEKILSGHDNLLTRCQSMQQEDGKSCTIRHNASFDIPKVLYDLGKSKQRSTAMLMYSQYCNRRVPSTI
jgi:hypothetical protein